MKRVLLSKALEKYRKEVSILKKGRVQEAYRIDQISRSFLGAKMVHQITTVDIATYRDQRLATPNPKTKQPLSRATVRLEMSLLSTFFEIARIEWGMCSSNPVSNVRKPKAPPGRERRISAREEKLILRYCHAYQNKELYSIFVLAIESAMRQGEILKLRWEHVNLRSRVVHLPDTKNNSKRDVPLSLRAREALIRLGAKTEGNVFNYLSAGLKSVWRVMMLKLRIVDCHFHDIRHECTSRLFELGTLDMMEVAAITGHKSLAMLKRYTHLKAQRLVRKLDSGRNKAFQAVSDLMLAYPAEKAENARECVVRILDFQNLAVRAKDWEEAQRKASVALLQRLSIMAIKGMRIPQPDQYLQEVDRRNLVMIDPITNRDQIEQHFELDTLFST